MASLDPYKNLEDCLERCSQASMNIIAAKKRLSRFKGLISSTAELALLRGTKMAQVYEKVAIINVDTGRSALSLDFIVNVTPPDEKNSLYLIKTYAGQAKSYSGSKKRILNGAQRWLEQSFPELKDYEIKKVLISLQEMDAKGY